MARCTSGAASTALHAPCGSRAALPCSRHRPVLTRALACPLKRQWPVSSLAEAAALRGATTRVSQGLMQPAAREPQFTRVAAGGLAEGYGNSGEQDSARSGAAGATGVVQLTQGCLSGHAAIERAFPEEAAAARSSRAAQHVRVYRRCSVDQQLHPYDVTLAATRGGDRACRLYKVYRVVRGMGLQGGDAVQLVRMPDGRVVLEVAARAAQQQRRITAAKPIVLKAHNMRHTAIDVPLRMLSQLLGADIAVHSPPGTEIAVRLEEGSGGGVRDDAAAAASTGGQGGLAASAVLRSYRKAGRLGPAWVLLGLAGALRAHGAWAVGTELHLAVEHSSPKEAGDSSTAAVASGTVDPPVILVAIRWPEGEGAATAGSQAAAAREAAPAGSDAEGALHQGGSDGEGADTARSSTNSGVTGGSSTGVELAEECGVVQYNWCAFKGISALRTAFPDQIQAAQASREPQAVTLHARLQDGRLHAYQAMLFPRFNPLFMCSMRRTRALCANLGLQHGDHVRLLRLADGRIVVEAEASIDANAITLSRSSAAFGSAPVPARLVSRLLGPEIAAQGTDGPGFPLRLEPPASPGRDTPRLLSEMPLAGAAPTWGLRCLGTWFRSQGAVAGDCVRLEAVRGGMGGGASGGAGLPTIVATFIRQPAGAAPSADESPAAAAAAAQASADAAGSTSDPVRSGGILRDAGRAEDVRAVGDDGSTQPCSDSSSSDEVSGEASACEAGTLSFRISEPYRLVGAASLRSAFPALYAAAVETRTPQPITLYCRQADGRLRPYGVALKPFGKHCAVTRVTLLMRHLGLQQGDRVSLVVQPDGRPVVQPAAQPTGRVSAAAPNLRSLRRVTIRAT